MGLFNFFKKGKEPKEPKPPGITDKLAELGYFKYAVEEDVEPLKEAVEDGLLSNHLFSLFFSEKPFHSKDFRHYNLNGVLLCEPGGIPNILTYMKVLFDKMGIRMEVSDLIEEGELGVALNRGLTLNGKRYTLFTAYPGEAAVAVAQRFADMVNDQFAILGQEEQLFLGGSGDEGWGVILTEAQFELLEPILRLRRQRPMRVADWCAAVGVDRTAVE